jgi:hypothetical protein
MSTLAILRAGLGRRAFAALLATLAAAATAQP